MGYPEDQVGPSRWVERRTRAASGRGRGEVGAVPDAGIEIRVCRTYWNRDSRGDAFDGGWGAQQVTEEHIDNNLEPDFSHMWAWDIHPDVLKEAKKLWGFIQ